jgi:hypothetical protein
VLASRARWIPRSVRHVPHRLLLAVALASTGCRPDREAPPTLWQAYEQTLKHARYVDLTHVIAPAIPVWPGFAPSTFGPAVDPKTNRPHTWAKDGFKATRYGLATDQLGTQLDWNSARGLRVR